jgi:hypothetical protein
MEGGGDGVVRDVEANEGGVLSRCDFAAVDELMMNGETGRRELEIAASSFMSAAS